MSYHKRTASWHTTSCTAQKSLIACNIFPYQKIVAGKRHYGRPLLLRRRWLCHSNCVKPILQSDHILLTYFFTTVLNANLLSVFCHKVSQSTFCSHNLFYGYAVAQLVDALRYKPKGRGFDSLPIPVTKRSKVRVYGRSLVGVVGSYPAGDWMLVLCIVSKDKRQEAGESRQRNKYG